MSHTMTNTERAMSTVSHLNAWSPSRAGIFISVSSVVDWEASAFMRSRDFILNSEWQTTQKERRAGGTAIFALVGMPLPFWDREMDQYLICLMRSRIRFCTL